MPAETNSTPQENIKGYSGNFYADLAQSVEAQRDVPARDKIIKAGTPQYNQAEQQKALEVDPQTRLLTRHYKNRPGENITLLGTEHIFEADHPQAQALREMVDGIADPSKAVFILEGQYDDETQLPSDPDEAIKVGGGEFNYLRALAEKRGIEVVPAEPNPHDTARQILQERADISRSEIALHYALKVLASVIAQG